MSFIKPSGKSIYGIHDNVGIKYIYQLRVGLSPLKSHKYNHNFADTPTDLCNCNIAPEDTRHFMPECPHFTTQRQTLLSSARNHLNIDQHHFLNEIDVFLYGSRVLSFSKNKNILLATINYLKSSKRLSDDI